MKRRPYFDINCYIGRRSSRDARFPYTAQELENDMCYFGVNGALVCGFEAIDYSFIQGNELLLEICSGKSRFAAAPAVPVTAPLESHEGDTYFERLKKSGARAFRLLPRTFNHGFDPFYMEKTAQFLAENKMPFIIDTAECSFSELRFVLEAYPELNGVITGVSWGSNRQLYPLLEKYANLYFDISSDQANDILTIVKQNFGIERALFGTYYPYKSPGGLKALVEYAFISENDKDAVAYKNACRLLGIDGNSLQQYDGSPLDEIAAAVDCGKPLSDVTVIDSHTHMVDTAHKTTSSNIMLNSGADDIVAKMDSLGIDTIITCPWQGISTDGIAANETTLAAMRKYPGRFEGFACCNPNYDEDLDGVFEYHEKHGFIGIKPYWPYHKYDICGEKYEKWYKYADEHGLLMLMHSGDAGTVEKIGRLAEKYPNITYILAHSGIDYNVADMNIKCAIEHANVLLEITYTSLTYGIIEYMHEAVGPKRILFGSDLPMRDPAPQLAWVAYARIPEEDKKMILGENMRIIINKIKNNAWRR